MPEVSLDRPFITVAPCATGWMLKGEHLTGLHPSQTHFQTRGAAENAMECVEHAIRKALDLPDWRSLAASRSMPLAVLGPGGDFTRRVSTVGDLLGVGCDVKA